MIYIYMYIYLIHVHIYTSLMPWVTRQNGTDMELSVLVLKGTDMGQKMVSLVTICRNTLVVRCRMPAGSGQMLRDKQNQWNLILKSFEMYIWKYVVWDACLSKPWLGGQKAQGCFNWGYNSESMFLRCMLQAEHLTFAHYYCHHIAIGVSDST